jgi:hypothetical protein
MRNITSLALMLFFSLIAFSQDIEIVKPSPLPEGHVYVKGSYQLYHRLAKLAPELQGSGMEKLAKDFRSGGMWSFEGGVRVAKHQYVGLTHSRYSNNGSFRVTRQLQSPTIGTVTTWDEARLRERVSYTGINYSYLIPLSAGHRSFFTTKAGIGMWGYHVAATAFNRTDELKKSGLGYQLGAGAEVRLSRNISWVADLELLTGGVEVEEAERENLTQFRGGTGLMLRF